MDGAIQLSNNWGPFSDPAYPLKRFLHLKFAPFRVSYTYMAPQWGKAIDLQQGPVCKHRAAELLKDAKSRTFTALVTETPYLSRIHWGFVSLLC